MSRPEQLPSAMAPAKLPGGLAPTTRCPICGDPMELQLWKCERCHTPHHSDCAEYFGGCGIFGCRDGAPPTRLEMATWPRAVSLLGWLTRVRSVQTVVLSACILGPATMALSTVLDILGIGGMVYLALLGLVMLLGAGTVYLLLDVVASGISRSIRRELGSKRSEHLPIARGRLAKAIPRLTPRSWWLRSLNLLGFSFAVAGLIVFFLNGSGSTLVAFSIVAMYLLAGVRQLEAHRQQLELNVHRFTATFAPLPEKTSEKAGSQGERDCPSS